MLFRSVTLGVRFADFKAISGSLTLPSPIDTAHELYAAALTLYAQRRLSLGKARELAGLSLWEFRQWLATRRIEAHYDADDLQDDLDALRALGRLP